MPWTVSEVQSGPARWPNSPQKPAFGSSSGAVIGNIFFGNIF